MMTDKPFRVLLDLTDLHFESFKYVWMNVSPRELKTIADFKTSVLQKINLEREDIKLFVRDGLLLDNETVIILREDDTVKVQYEGQYHSFHIHSANSSKKDNSVKESKKFSRKRNLSEKHSDVYLNHKRCRTDDKILSQGLEEIPHDEMSKKKRKKHKKPHSISPEKVSGHSTIFEVDSLNAGESHKEKDKKQLLESSVTVSNLQHECDSFFSCDTQDIRVEKIKDNSSWRDINVGSSNYLKLNSIKYSSPKSNFNDEQNMDLHVKETFNINAETSKKSESLGNNCPKKKRKRRKKRKQIPKTLADVPDITEIKSNFKSFTDQVSNESVNGKHIVYSSSPCEGHEVIKLDCGDIIQEVENFSGDTFAVDEGGSNVVTAQPSNNYPRISTPAQSDGYKIPSWHLSVTQKSNLIPHCRETPGFKKGNMKSSIHNKSVVQDISIQSPEKYENSLEVKYTDLPPLNSRPDIGTHIAYKILELDENYSPVISDYREGIVKTINLDSEEMEIELMKHEIKPGRIGKFENLKDDEVPPPEIQTCDTVRWSALIQPKLIFC